MRDGYEPMRDRFIEEAVQDRVVDLETLTRSSTPERRGTFALVGATIVDGTDARPIANGTVMVRDGRIAAVGPSAAVTVDGGVPAIDVTGSTIVPGLWDMHAHASQVDWAPVYLASGVTTIRDMGGETRLPHRVPRCRRVRPRARAAPAPGRPGGRTGPEGVRHRVGLDA